MSEIIRLVRIGLALRVATSILAAVAATLSLNPATVVFELVIALPSLAILAAAWLAPRQGWSSERFARGLLIAVILAQTAETLASRALYRLFLPQPLLAEIATWLGRTAGEPQASSSMPLRLGVPLLFIAVAVILGAWMDGRRRWGRWATFGAALGLIGILPYTAADLEQFRLYIGVFAAQVIVMSITGYFVGSLADRQRSEQARLEAANRQLAEQARMQEQLATSRERMRLARDLHDTLAHTLAGLSVQLKVVETMLQSDPAAASQELARAQEVARQGLGETRAAIADLRVNVVQDLGLGGALRRHVALVGQRSGIEARFEQTGNEPVLDVERAEALFRITQEALNNVERHAQARHVNVALRYAAGERSLFIEVRDDGAGFDAAALDEELAEGRYGLRGMRERAEQIGARLRVDSAAGRGTCVTVTGAMP